MSEYDVKEEVKTNDNGFVFTKKAKRRFLIFILLSVAACLIMWFFTEYHEATYSWRYSCTIQALGGGGVESTSEPEVEKAPLFSEVFTNYMMLFGRLLAFITLIVYNIMNIVDYVKNVKPKRFIHLFRFVPLFMFISTILILIAHYTYFDSDFIYNFIEILIIICSLCFCGMGILVIVDFIRFLMYRKDARFQYMFCSTITCFATLVLLLVWYSYVRPEPVMISKPVIYLYGYDEEVNVKVNFDDNTDFSVVYPEYREDGWTVTAVPDGHLYDPDGKEYRYLYYEADTSNDYGFDEGFCVSSKDIAWFLEDNLSKLGLNSDERNEFIIYWLPIMKEYDYCVVSFLTGSDYDVISELELSEEPDNELRVYMLWYGSDKDVEITPQVINDVSGEPRTGKTVVEWGGSKIR